eukprot:6213156-Pleurochrysis_carterae.AAC.1
MLKRHFRSFPVTVQRERHRGVSDFIFGTRSPAPRRWCFGAASSASTVALRVAPHAPEHTQSHRNKLTRASTDQTQLTARMGSKGSKGASSTKSRSRADSQKLGSQASHGADKDDRVAAHIAMVETMQKQMQQMDDKIKAISTQNEALQGEVALLRSETRLREPPPQSQTNDNVAPVSVSSPKSARLEGPSRSRLEDVIITTDQGDSVLREQVYGLSRNIGLMQNFLSIDNLRRMLKGWRLAATEEARSSAAENIRNHYVRNCTLLVSDMSGFTRITKEDGICHFLMLTKQMQAMCIPLIESFGGTLVKVCGTHESYLGHHFD